MQPRDVVIVSACRTAIGKFQGQFKDVSARELAITAGKEAIRRAGIDINTIDEIVMGECYTACLLYTSRVDKKGPECGKEDRNKSQA